MRFSKRTNWPLVQNKLAQVLETKKKKSIPLVDLTESNPTLCQFEYLNAELLKPFTDPKNLTYDPDPHGLLKAREKICGYYFEKGIRVDPAQVFLTANTSEAYSLLFRLLCDPQDRILVPKPSYPLLDYLSDLNDIQALFYDLHYDRGWSIQKEAFPAEHSSKTKAFVVVNPNNPTGHFMSESDWRFVTDTCQKGRCAVISDEVFFDYSWSAGTTVRSAAANEEVLSFTLGGVSKLLGLPQMKLGWIVVSGPPEEKEEAIRRLEVIMDTYLSVNTPVQNALSAWLQKHPHRREIKDRCLQNLSVLRKIAQKGPLRLLEGEGGWYAVLSWEGKISDEALAVQLLEEYNVVVHPGYLFNFENENQIVISLLPPLASFQKGVECFLKCM